ncbi:MAG: hypothetical protein U0640_06370 [Phycisphaerales bacterium]
MSVAGVPNSPQGPFGSGLISAHAAGASRISGVRPVEVLADGATPIDTLMDRASEALVKTQYFDAIDFSLRALQRAIHKRDWEHVARITMPLQEARRQIRQLACDAGKTFVLRTLPARGTTIEPGCYLLEPPMIGLDGKTFRDMARARKVPVLALVKEPTTSAGKWPIVGVGTGQFENVVARVQVEPPASLAGYAGSLAQTDAKLLPDAAWFQMTLEALGDAAIRKVRAEWPAAHRVEDLAEYLDAVPDHEKLSQALAAAAKEAVVAPAPVSLRRRPYFDDPHSF